MSLQELEDLELGDWSEDVSVGLWGEGRERYAMTTSTSDTSIREFIKVRGGPVGQENL